MKSKEKSIFIVLLLSLFMIPIGVNAESDEELCNRYKQTHNNGIISINAVNPSYIDEKLRSNYVNGITFYDKNLYYNDYYENKRWNSDYSTYTVNIKDNEITHETFNPDSHVGYVCNPNYSGTKCALNVKWSNYDDSIGQKVKSFKNKIPKQYMVDIEYVKQQLNYFENLYDKTKIKKSDYPNITPLLDEHIKLPENESNLKCISYSGSPVPSEYTAYPYSNGIETLLVYYDNVAYDILEDSKLYGYRVVYVPKDTKESEEDYINAVNNRLNSINAKVKKNDFESDNSYNVSEIKYGMDNGLIDKTLNSSFQPFHVLLGKNDEYYTEIIIAKGTDEQVYGNNTNTNNTTRNNEVVSVPDTDARNMSKSLFGMSLLLLGSAVIIFELRKRY